MAGGQQLAHARFVEFAIAQDARTFEHDAFLVDVHTIRGHGTGRDATDVRMMRSTGDIKAWRFCSALEHWSHDGDIGQVRAASVGGVDGVRISRLHP